MKKHTKLSIFKILSQKYFLELGIRIQHKQKYVFSKTVMIIMIFLGHLSMLIESALYGIGMMIIFHFIQKNHFYFEHANELLSMIPVMFFAVMYVVSAGLVISGLWSDYKEISLGIFLDNEEPFVMHKAIRIASTSHLLLGVLSLFTLSSIMLIDWSEALGAGRYVVFSVSFLMMLIFIIGIEMDDVENCSWFQHKIPPHWVKIDAKKYLKEKHASKKVVAAATQKN